MEKLVNYILASLTGSCIPVKYYCCTMFSEHWSRKIYMNYLRLQQVICKFAECWLVTLLTLGSNDTGFLDCCWLMVRMMVVFLVVADSADFWCWWRWRSPPAARFLRSRCQLHHQTFSNHAWWAQIVDGGHKWHELYKLIVGQLVNHYRRHHQHQLHHLLTL